MTRFLALLLAAALSSAALPASAETVRFATEGAFPPWDWTNPDGSLGGYEIDLYKELCKRADLTCEIQAQAFDGLIPALNAGKFDAIISGMSITPKREEAVLFTLPYGSTGQTFGTLKSDALAAMPLKGEAFSLTTEEAAAVAALDKIKPLVKGKTIGVQSASIASAFVDKYLKGVVEVREYKTTDQHDLDLQAGRVDFIMASTAYLTTAAKKAGNEGLVLVGPRFQGGVVGRGSAIAVRKDNAALKTKLDAAIQSTIDDGTLRRLSDQYFGYDVTPH